VVVASGISEVDVWFDVLDASAYHYCAAPFEPRLIGQIVNNALDSRCWLLVGSPLMSRAESGRPVRP
jgi:hypothetical protein